MAHARLSDDTARFLEELCDLEVVAPFDWVMSADLALTPTTSLTTQLGGDAHLLNIETFATPERRLVLDITDFDETIRGPFEWDLKRMATSLVVAARDRGFDSEVADEAVHGCLTQYRSQMRDLRDDDVLDVWHASRDEQEVLDALGQQVEDGDLGADLLTTTKREFDRARRRTSRHAAATRGPPRSRDALPDELRGEPADRSPRVARTLRGGGRGAPGGRGRQRRHAVLRDPAARPGRGRPAGPATEGGGTVGARASRAHPRTPLPHGRRVVEGQRTIQAASDAFLGWLTAAGPDGVERDFYVRQFRSMKGGVRLDRLDADGLVSYSRLCGKLLADAHARGGHAAELAGYLGVGDGFVEAMISFAHAYADVTEHDHRLLLDAIAAGRVPHDPED
jgi:hypothetical protein